MSRQASGAASVLIRAQGPETTILFLLRRLRQSEKALKKDKQVAECRDEESADSVLQKLRFERIQLSSSGENVLVEAGPGCLRGGQGSNGAMWIVQLGRGNATVLASSAEGFEGYLYSVQATTSKGYRDIVLGWHMSASESGLACFRFDGTRYRTLSGATIRRDDDGNETITPAR
jgi:hypothetical protein